MAKLYAIYLLAKHELLENGNTRLKTPISMNFFKRNIFNFIQNILIYEIITRNCEIYQ